MDTIHVSVAGYDVPLQCGNGFRPGNPRAVLQQIADFAPFREWLHHIGRTAEFVIVNIAVTSADFFGSRVGWARVSVKAVSTDGSIFTISSFIRGSAATLLPVLECEGVDYCILVEPMRAGIGSKHTEIPTGLLDEQGNFIGQAADIILDLAKQAELELSFRFPDIVDMSEIASKGRFAGIYTLPATSDENYRQMLYKSCIHRGELQRLLEVADKSQWRIVPCSTVWQACPDVRTLSSVFLYLNLQQIGYTEPTVAANA
eukprot:TRINITY_DN17942_c0_g1_i1.p1 TRINITY_DN17942_c0_g1~~TRINITY_DN17942_c0_g1_i1.p1  ORF type:complete len:259 (-),score=27.86 TRINITY_DN17942_c0_g1_i1:96-872(-)